MILNVEIYVDHIVDLHINNMNSIFGAVRQIGLVRQWGGESDLYLCIVELAQVSENEYFGYVVEDGLKAMIRTV